MNFLWNNILQVLKGGELVEGSRHDARDLVSVERQGFQVVQAQEHFLVEHAQLVFGQQPATKLKYRHFLSID